jgi:hypothetical protein
MAMLTRVGILDALTPAVAAWLQDMNPGSARALRRAGLLIRRAAVANIRGAFRRTGRNRTFGGQRGVKLRLDQSGGIRTLRIWHSSGILAAHELGSTVPAVTIRPTGKRVLAWGGPPGGPHTQFARVIHRRGFTLRRRPTLGPAYASNASAVYEFLEAEYQRVLNQAPPAVPS